jgi:hypothetical protein
MSAEAMTNEGRLPPEVQAALRAIPLDERRNGAMVFETIMRAWYAEKEATGRAPNLRPLSAIGRALGLDVEAQRMIIGRAMTHAATQRRIGGLGLGPRRQTGRGFGRERRWVMQDESGRNVIVTR